MPQKILITGSTGQLGQSFFKIYKNYPEFEFTFADRQILDFSKPADFSAYFKQHKFDFCVNCTAYTKVDLAETEQELALKINAEAVGVLATELTKQQAKLIHISTDYVFDGHNYQPYLESDKTKPVNFYGLSKLEGEKLALANNPKTLVIRTSWVWSEFGNNFVKTMQKLGSIKPELTVVSDQIGGPTYAGDLAEAILKIISFIQENQDFEKYGIYNFSGEGICSWYDFASSIMDIYSLNCQVKPIPSQNYPTPAKRPFYSVLDKTKIKQAFDLTIPNWRESLKRNQF